MQSLQATAEEKDANNIRNLIRKGLSSVYIHLLPDLVSAAGSDGAAYKRHNLLLGVQRLKHLTIWLDTQHRIQSSIQL